MNEVRVCCGPISAPLDETEAAILAARFKAVADPTRLRILSLLLRNGECCVCDVESNFDLTQPTISHHLSLLLKAGLVRREVRGRWAWYTAAPDAIRDLSEVLKP